MSPEQRFRSTSQLFKAVRKDAKAGRKRDYVTDGQEFIPLQHVEVRPEFKSKVPDIRSLICTNHHTRPFLERRFPTTTRELFRDMAVVSVATQAFTQRRMTWYAAELPGRFFGVIPRPDHALQRAAMFCYEMISVNDKKASMLNAYRTLRRGWNLGAFPEAANGMELNYHTDFPANIKLLQAVSEKTEEPTQIIPVSIFNEGNVYRVIFNEPIPVELSEEPEYPVILVRETMRRIAMHLPPHLQGIYRGKI